MKRALRTVVSSCPIAGLLLSMSCCLPPAHAQIPSVPFSSVVIFGDSLSDTGNLAHVTDNDFLVRYPGPDFNYTDGRFTDGADTKPPVPLTPGHLAPLGVWHEQLAQDFLSLLPTKNSLDGGLNYAYGDATTQDGTATVSDGALSISVENMGQQVTDYLTRPGASLDPKALFVLWGGGDDLFGDATPGNIVAAPARLAALADRLAQAGAVNILILNLPPLGSTPGFKGQATTIAALNAATTAYNAQLSSDLDTLQANLNAAGLHVRIYRLDIYTLFQGLVANSATYGFTNIVDPAQGVTTADPDSYLFWDDVHPTTAGHYNIAVAANSVLKIPSVVLTFDPGTSLTPGEAVTLKAVVTSQSPLPAATGTVDFYDSSTASGTLLGSGTLDNAGLASFTSSALAAGSYNVVAVYSGDAANLPSSSAPQTLTVAAATTTTTLTSSLNPAGTGQVVVLTAVVAPASGGGTPTGTVTFLDGTVSMGTGTLDNTGKATLSNSTLALGAHSITASYAGDANYMGSVSAALTETIVPPSITLTANPTSIKVVRGGSGGAVITETSIGGAPLGGTLACTNLPVDASCSFVEGNIVTGGPNPTQMINMTISTKATASAALERPMAGGSRGMSFALLFMPWIGVAGATALRRKRPDGSNGMMMLVLGVCCLAGMAGLAACGSNSNETPKGTYNIAVTFTGSAGGTTSLTIPVTVQ